MIFHQTHNSGGRYNYNAFFYEKEVWEPHFHKNYELIYVVKGNIECTVNNSSFSLKEGDFGLCLPYAVHSIQPQSNTKYWVMVFSEDFIHTFGKQTSQKKAATIAFTCDPSVKEFLLHNLIYSQNTSIYLLKSCLYAVCNEFKKSVVLEENKETQNIDAICSFLEQKHTENISLKDLSQLLGYDYHYVSRYFNSMFNMSFTEFLNTYRIQTALSLLEEDGKKIVDIAYESGFKSVRNFNYCFKKSMGMTPLEYKKTSKK